MNGYTFNPQEIQAAAGQVLADIGKHLQQETGQWFGPIDVQNGLLHALRALDATRAIILHNKQRGLDVAPARLWPAWTHHLNNIAGCDAVTEPALRLAVSRTMLLNYGLRGGSILVFRHDWRLDVHPLVYDAESPLVRGVKAWMN